LPLGPRFEGVPFSYDYSLAFLRRLFLRALYLQIKEIGFFINETVFPNPVLKWKGSFSDPFSCVCLFHSDPIIGSFQVLWSRPTLHCSGFICGRLPGVDPRLISCAFLVLVLTLDIPTLCSLRCLGKKFIVVFSLRSEDARPPPPCDSLRLPLAYPTRRLRTRFEPDQLIFPPSRFFSPVSPFSSPSNTRFLLNSRSIAPFNQARGQPPIMYFGRRIFV